MTMRWGSGWVVMAAVVVSGCATAPERIAPEAAPEWDQPLGEGRWADGYNEPLDLQNLRIYAEPLEFQREAKGQRDEGLLDELKRREGLPESGEEEVDIRLQAVEEAAVAVASQKALMWRYGLLMDTLKSQEARLDAIYNFGRLMLEGVVLPPVVSEINDAHRQLSASATRTIKKGYRIEYPARVATLAPTWRDFLYLTFHPPEPVPSILMPRNDVERAAWERGIDAGWEKGVDQANRMFEVNVNILSRVYMGMMAYHRLLREGVVTAPNIARTQRGVVIDGNSMNVGDVVTRLTVQPIFQPYEDWTVRERVY